MAVPLLIDTIQQLVADALETARKENLLQLETIPEIQVERPGNSSHGDFATNLPLRLARATRINPLELAIPESFYQGLMPLTKRRNIFPWLSGMVSDAHTTSTQRLLLCHRVSSAPRLKSPR